MHEALFNKGMRHVKQVMWGRSWWLTLVTWDHNYPWTATLWRCLSLPGTWFICLNEACIALTDAVRWPRYLQLWRRRLVFFWSEIWRPGRIHKDMWNGTGCLCASEMRPSRHTALVGLTFICLLWKSKQPCTLWDTRAWACSSRHCALKWFIACSRVGSRYKLEHFWRKVEARRIALVLP